MVEEFRKHIWDVSGRFPVCRKCGAEWRSGDVPTGECPGKLS